MKVEAEKRGKIKSLEKYYYVNKKEKKKYIKTIVKKAPELKKRRLAAWICALSGIVIWIITQYLLFQLDISSSSYVLFVDKKVTFFGGGGTCVGLVLMVLSYCIWHKRFETYGGEHYLKEEKYLYQNEEYIEFTYHRYKNMAARYGEEREEFPNELSMSKYPYEVIRKMQYDPETHLLTLTGAMQYERYWNYKTGDKDVIEAPAVKYHDYSEIQFLICYDGAGEFLDNLYEKIKDTVWEEIEKTW